MIKKLGKHSGQTILSEWVLTGVIVLAALTVMSTYVRRAYQARIYDADTYMLGKVGNAFSNYIALEYEPYYTVSQSLANSAMKRSYSTGSGAYVIGYDDGKSQAVKTIQEPPMNWISWW